MKTHTQIELLGVSLCVLLYGNDHDGEQQI